MNSILETIPSSIKHLLGSTEGMKELAKRGFLKHHKCSLDQDGSLILPSWTRNELKSLQKSLRTFKKNYPKKSLQGRNIFILPNDKEGR